MDNPKPRQEVNQLYADICAALADPNRILIVYMLAEAPCNVNSLAKKVGLSQPSVSRHLKILRERGLVRAVRSANTVAYHLSDARLINVLDILRTVLHDRLAQRASLVEELQE